jgi:hypothetical protein
MMGKKYAKKWALNLIELYLLNKLIKIKKNKINNKKKDNKNKIMTANKNKNNNKIKL